MNEGPSPEVRSTRGAPEPSAPADPGSGLTPNDIGAHLAPKADVRRVLLSSATALVVAVLLMFLLHETAHSLASLALGLRAVQYPPAVDTLPAPTGAVDATIALAGPIFSLVSGLILIAVLPRRAGSWWLLLATWFGYVSVMEFVGYLMTTPFGSTGDIGHAFAALGWPDVASWVAFVLGGIGMVALARSFSTRAVRWTRDLYEIRAFTVWTWLFGGLAIAALEAVFLTLMETDIDGAAIVLVMMATFAVGSFAPLSMSFYRREFARTDPADRPRQAAPGVPVTGWILLAVLIGVNLLLTQGLQLG